MHPRSQLRAVSRRDIPALGALVVDAIRACAPAARRIGHRQSWRRKDALRGALNPVHTLQLILDEDRAAGATLEQQLRVAHAIETYICLSHGVEAPSDWRAALVEETRAECAANPVQAEALATPGRGVFATLREHLFHHERKLRDARLAVERELFTPAAVEPARPSLVR
jgi:hypothetical protein